MVSLSERNAVLISAMGSRELAAEVALGHMEKTEDFTRYMPTVQHWIRANLFDAAGVGAVEQNPRRGKSRRFPVEALRWVRLFARLANRGVAEIEFVTSALNQRFRDAIDDALARRGADVWLVYGSAPPLTYVLNLQVQRGAVHLSHGDGVSDPAVATCVNLTSLLTKSTDSDPMVDQGFGGLAGWRWVGRGRGRAIWW